MADERTEQERHAGEIAAKDALIAEAWRGKQYIRRLPGERERGGESVKTVVGALAIAGIAAIIHPGQPESAILTICMCVVFRLVMDARKKEG
jgi:hypothetical protein